jgi:hypothetical protein
MNNYVHIHIQWEGAEKVHIPSLCICAQLTEVFSDPVKTSLNTAIMIRFCDDDYISIHDLIRSVCSVMTKDSIIVIFLTHILSSLSLFL